VRELPSGTVTLLFIDIEGSTRLLHELGDRYAEALADHRRLLRECFLERDGREVDTQGDALFVAFPRASDAVAAAVAAQRRLAGHLWPDGVPLRVRMGIHSGEPALTGEGYVGIDLHRGARICAAGHGGQVLLSQTTHELLSGHEPDATSLRDLGEHRLKDRTQPQRLYQPGHRWTPDRVPAVKDAGEPPDQPPDSADAVAGPRAGAGGDRWPARPGGDQVGDPHRTRRYWQDSPGPASRGRGAGRVPGRGLLRRPGRGHRSTPDDYLLDKRLLLLLDNFEQVT
jgi:class 3 adenylate cyclase